jgi:hypothetical protein
LWIIDMVDSFGGSMASVPSARRARLPTALSPDLFPYAEVEGVELRLDGAETQVRRPQAGRPGRRRARWTPR